VSLCGAPVLCLGVLMWGPGRVVSLAAPVVLVVTMAGLGVTLSTRSPTVGDLDHQLGAQDRRNRRHELRREARWWGCVLTGSVSVMLCVALAAALASWCVPVTLLALAGTTPPGHRWLRARTRVSPDLEGGRARDLGLQGRAGHGVHLGQARGRPSVRLSDEARPFDGSRTADLDTDELCHLWRVTFWMVRDLRAPARTLYVVELREEVLDELERRHPHEVARWLTSGRHGADGPARYL
jgi:hypothetical protein